MERYDCIVVGSGGGGAVAAYRLAELGKAVLIIEKGDYSKRREYPSNYYNWETLKQSAWSFNPNLRRNPADYPVDCVDSPIDVAMYNGVGGSTVLYSGHYPRFRPQDFSVLSDCGVGVDWPITYDDLEPHYLANEVFLKVAGLPGDPSYPGIFTHLMPPIPLGRAGKLVASGFDQLGWHWWPSYSAILLKEHDDWPDREPCANVGPCNTGCPKAAKASCDVTFLPRASALGVSIKTNMTVTRVLLHGNKALGVETRDIHGQISRISAEKIILAGNAIGTCRILWGSTQGSGFLGNSSGLVGKNLMIHPLAYVGGILDGASDAHVGPQGSWLASHEFYSDDYEGRGFHRGYSMHILKGAGPLEFAKQALRRNHLDLSAGKLLEQVKQGVANSVGIAIISEDMPEESNQVIMKKSLAADGLPEVSMCYSISKNTRLMLSHGAKSGEAVLKTIGGKSLYASAPVKFAGWHLTGTCRMGVDSRTSVVDPCGRMHDVDNLYIVDGSVFPTSGGVNPLATIQAVARYIAGKIVNDW